MFDRAEMKAKLKAGICTVTFNKVNGEQRVMECTLSEDIIPVPVASDEEINRNRAPNEDVQVVWDVNKEGWRSYRIANVTAFA